MSKLAQIQKLLEEMKGEGGDVTFTQNHELPFVIGKAYFIRTVTYFATGRVKDIIGKFLVLEDAAWVADTGRFSDAIAKGVADEVEPVEVPMYINTDSITDAFDWNKKLLREQK